MKRRALGVVGRLLAVVLLVLVSLVRGDVLSRDTLFGYRLAPLVRGRIYDFVGWEVGALGASAGRAFRGCPADVAHEKEALDQYLKAATRVRHLQDQLEEGRNPAPDAQELRTAEAEADRLAGRATRFIECLVGDALAEEEISLEVPLYRGIFPPVLFAFTRPPLALIVSPREKIEMQHQIYLWPGMEPEEKETLEARVDALGVSSLVVGVGGLSTYPTMVLEGAPLAFVVSTVAHEWFHGYLTFRPLGQNYGASRELTTMNETAASIVGDEIGEKVLARYWPEELRKVRGEVLPGEVAREAFFTQEMRAIRLRVDELLAEGKIGEAESFMEERRAYLEGQGYDLRKLNQAYFAFYGSYATAPESVDPIGQELKDLRARSASLKEFIEVVGRMSSYQDLKAALKG